MTIDLEDWFQVENLNGQINRNDWSNFEYRIENSTDTILGLLEKYNSNATFFVLGSIAEDLPHLIKNIHQRGHEIASHGYSHSLSYNLSKGDFLDDLRRTKKLLEDITGEKIYGFRAPSFSISDHVIEVLKEEQYVYDSSLFPSVLHDRYGKISENENDHNSIFELSKGFYELPLSCYKILGAQIPWAGGGYFRMLPYHIFNSGIKKIVMKNSYYNFYIHPWEFDPNQPKIKGINWSKKFRHYNNLNSTRKKFEKLLKDFQFKNAKEILGINSKL